MDNKISNLNINLENKEKYLKEIKFKRLLSYPKYFVLGSAFTILVLKTNDIIKNLEVYGMGNALLSIGAIGTYALMMTHIIIKDNIKSDELAEEERKLLEK